MKLKSYFTIILQNVSVPQTIVEYTLFYKCIMILYYILFNIEFSSII